MASYKRLKSEKYFGEEKISMYLCYSSRKRCCQDIMPISKVLLYTKIYTSLYLPPQPAPTSVQKFLNRQVKFMTNLPVTQTYQLQQKCKTGGKSLPRTRVSLPREVSPPSFMSQMFEKCSFRCQCQGGQAEDWQESYCDGHGSNKSFGCLAHILHLQVFR